MRVIAQQLWRCLKTTFKQLKKIKGKKKNSSAAKFTRSKSRSPVQATDDAPIWSCPVLEALTTEEKPIEIAARRPYLTGPPIADHTSAKPPTYTQGSYWPMPILTTPEDRLETHRNVYLRLRDIGQHCGYDMVVDMLTILKERQDAGYDIRFNIVDYDPDLRLGFRPHPLGRRFSLRNRDDWYF